MKSRKIEYHGMTKSKNYIMWKNMKQRCNNPKNERLRSGWTIEEAIETKAGEKRGI